MDFNRPWLKCCSPVWICYERYVANSIFSHFPRTGSIGWDLHGYRILMGKVVRAPEEAGYPNSQGAPQIYWESSDPGGGAFSRGSPKILCCWRKFWFGEPKFENWSTQAILFLHANLAHAWKNGLDAILWYERFNDTNLNSLVSKICCYWVANLCKKWVVCFN